VTTRENLAVAIPTAFWICLANDTFVDLTFIGRYTHRFDIHRTIQSLTFIRRYTYCFDIHRTIQSLTFIGRCIRRHWSDSMFIFIGRFYLSILLGRYIIWHSSDDTVVDIHRTIHSSTLIGQYVHIHWTILFVHIAWTIHYLARTVCEKSMWNWYVICNGKVGNEWRRFEIQIPNDADSMRHECMEWVVHTLVLLLLAWNAHVISSFNRPHIIHESFIHWWWYRW